METYRAFGIRAEYRSVNDIVTQEGRKIPLILGSMGPLDQG